MPTERQGEQERQALERARRLLASRRRVAERRSKIAPALTIAALTIIGFALTFAFDRDAKPARSDGAGTTTCGTDDSACLGARIISEVQAPCSRAIEAQLQHAPEWRDSAWERRFHSPAWYQPPDQLIFYGNRVTVQNAVGLKLEPAYFCVVTRGATVLRAELKYVP